MFSLLSTFCAAGLALAAMVKARRSLSRWAFALGMAVLAAGSLLVWLGQGTARDPLQWERWRLVAASCVPLPWLLFSLTYARGAVRTILARHWVSLGLAALLPLAFTALLRHAFAPASHSSAVFRLGGSGLLLHAAILVASVFIVMNLERTFRASVGTVRWRIKYMLLGVGVLFVVRIYTSSQVLVFRGVDPAVDALNAVAILVAIPLILRALFRAGHFEVDVYPSGSALRNSVTLLVAGVYLLLVGILAKAVAFLGGDAAFSLKAFFVLIALVGLALAIQSDRLQLRMRQMVSHHFRRPLHDYSAVWRRFTEATASQLDQPDLCRSIAVLIGDVFQALSIRIWLVNEKKDALRVIACTSGTPSSGDCVEIEAADIVARFADDLAPVDLDATAETWCERLRIGHPAEFPNGGHRVCVPLFGRGALLGVVTIGDRVSGIPFTTEDYELLKCIGDHAAASLLNVQLSQRLLQAKQLEAFQAMAAFFVHDLKNAAATLGLMLRNLPEHFAEPEFREDALRATSKTVDRINRLIGRLTALRHELTIQPTASDLNDVVTQSLAGFGQVSPAIVCESQPLPSIPLDRDQMQKVVTNLVLNATEATPPGGRVHVSTGQQNGWVVLTVDDTGCGMSESFIANSLFQPFQTTKKNGLGVGMFQSKMIVEAHGGRIAVSSRPGRGTRFQVFLRAPTATAGADPRPTADAGTLASTFNHASPLHHETETAHR